MVKDTFPEKFHFLADFEVRDYELDMLGMVNNAVYLNYLEHTRHLFLKSLNIDFAEMASKGIDLVVTRSEVDYKLSLRSGDLFTVRTHLKRQGKIRFVFYQEIVRKPDMALVLRAKIIGTALSPKGRPMLPEGWGELFKGLS